MDVKFVRQAMEFNSSQVNMGIILLDNAFMALKIQLVDQVVKYAKILIIAVSVMKHSHMIYTSIMFLEKKFVYQKFVQVKILI